MHARHWNYREFRRFMPNSANEVLQMLEAHVNERNRCWPTIGTLATEINMALGTIEAGKHWLLEHKAIEIVPFAERSGAKEKALSPNRHIYQLTGTLVIEGKTYPYWVLPPQTDNIPMDDMSPHDMSMVDIKGIIPSPEVLNQEESISPHPETSPVSSEPANAVRAVSPFGEPRHVVSALNTPKRSPVGRETKVDPYQQSPDRPSLGSGKDFLPSGKALKTPSKVAKKVPPNTEPVRNGIMDALADLCYGNHDKAVFTLNGSVIGKCASKLKSAYPDLSMGQIDAFGKWWYTKDFRGQKGQAPKPMQIPETWNLFINQGVGNGRAVLGQTTDNTNWGF